MCVAASRTYVQEAIAPKFIESLKASYETFSEGMGADPLELTTQLGPLADRNQFNTVMAYIEKGKENAELVTGGKRKGQKGYFVEPTIFKDPAANSSIYKEEIFGPVMVIKTFKTEEEAIELANNTSYGLSCELCRLFVCLCLRPC